MSPPWLVAVLFQEQMSASLPECDGCPVKAGCLAFSLGLAGATTDNIPRRLTELEAGEIVSQEERDDGSILILRHGWAARYFMFPDGRRQITDVMLPGDLVGCNEILTSDQKLPTIALSDFSACAFDKASFKAALMACTPRLQALMQICSGQGMRLRHLLAIMGRQSGTPRVAAFLLKLRHRLLSIDPETDSEMPFHLRQQDVADILGMTQVHVSRTMRALSDGGIISVGSRSIGILDLLKLERIAGR